MNKRVRAMKQENEPVSPDELLIRLIWKDHYDPNEEVVIQMGAFRPKKNEVDGISVFRAACLKDPEDALAVIAEEKRDKYGIVLLPVRELTALGLSVHSARIEEIAGHAVLPELNVDAVKVAKDHWHYVMMQLAALANQHVVRSPKT
jgi:hypothetical protein